LAILALGFAFVFLLILIEKIFGRSSSLALYPPFFWAFAAVTAKRLRDRGKSPIWFALALIPLIGPLWLLIEIGLLRGAPGENRYGADPLENYTDYMTVN
jgi:uncharacterized membrane protein YhaH (DUF805 family)